MQNNEQELFKDIDKFLAWYKSKRPETIYLVINKERYEEVIDAIKTICRLAKESNPTDTCFIADTDPLIGTSVCVTIISNLVVFDEMPEFASALSKASCFEVCARQDGKFMLGLTFQNVYKLAPPSK